MSKFLIVDDNKDKYEQIESILLENNIRKISIVWARSKKSALAHLRAERFLVVMLDLNLPEFDDRDPVENGGFEVLKKINKFKERYKKPYHIICLSAFENLIESQSKEFLTNDVSIHNFEHDTWKAALKNKIEWSLEVAHQGDNSRIEKQKIAITVHGIRTQGKWQSQLNGSLIKKYPHILCKNYKYNYFSSIKLLFPYFRQKVITEFRRALINILDDNPNAEVVFFAHSFGTFILFKSLEGLPRDLDFKIEKIVLAGCVLKENYDFNDIKYLSDKKNIVNDCGYDDNVLLLSKYFCIGMGLAGRSGFTGTEVTNRFHKGQHDFFYQIEGFIENNWLPVVDGEVYEIDEREFSNTRENLEIIVSSKFNLMVFLILSIVIIYLTTKAIKLLLAI